MNEHKQAEHLAAWLEDANSTHEDGTPAELRLEALEELDAEVRETLIALRPELAPAPRVSIDDILAGVTEGPLAKAPATDDTRSAMPVESAMPVGASVGASPEDAPLDGSSRSRRPWMFAMLGVGGMGSLVAAAALLLVVGTVAMNTPSDEAAVAMDGPPAAPMRASEPMGDAVAMEEARNLVDTGTPTADADAARPAQAPASRAASRPRPSPRPAAKPQVALDDAPAPEEEPDAVAFADELGVRGAGGAEGGDVYDGELQELGYIDSPASARGDEDATRTIPEVPRGGRARDFAQDAGSAEAAEKRPAKGSVAVSTEPAESAKSEQKARPKPDEAHQGRGAATAAAKEAESEARRQSEDSRLAAERRAEAEQLQEMEESVSAGAAAPMEPVDRNFDAGPSMDDAMSEPDMEPVQNAPAAQESNERSRNSLFGRKKAKEASQAPAAPPPAATPAPQPAAPPPPPADSSSPKAQQARQGVESTTSTGIRAAQAALDAGTPRVALAKIEAALGAGPSTAVRRHLLALKGDALLALGDRKGAEAAWDAAIALQSGP